MLKVVVQRIHDAGLQLNDSMRHINQSSLHFLGHSVSAQGIYPDEDHLVSLCFVLTAMKHNTGFLCRLLNNGKHH